MPDVKWYAGGDSSGITVGTTTTTGGTANRLLYDTGAVIAASQLERTSSTVLTVTGNSTLSVAGATGANFYGFTVSNNTASFIQLSADSGTNGTQLLYDTSDQLSITTAATLGAFATANIRLVLDATGSRVNADDQYTFSSSNSDPRTAADLGAARHAASSWRFTNGTTGTASVVLGTSSHPATPASTYLFIEGVSGAGGTPTSAHITAGSGVAIYTQQAHDAAATALVFAYNLGGSMRYISIPLDGTTATLTHNATRP